MLCGSPETAHPIKHMFSSTRLPTSTCLFGRFGRKWAIVPSGIVEGSALLMIALTSAMSFSQNWGFTFLSFCIQSSQSLAYSEASGISGKIHIEGLYSLLFVLCIAGSQCEFTLPVSAERGFRTIYDSLEGFLFR